MSASAASWLHATNSDPFTAFDPAFERAFASDAERGVIWLAHESAERELGYFGCNLAVCAVEGEMETVDYLDFAIDRDPTYMPEVMAACLAASTAPVLRIRNVALVEHGQPRIVLAVRDAARITITEWIEQ